MLKKIHKLFFSESGYFSGKVENRFMMTLCEVCKKKPAISETEWPVIDNILKILKLIRDKMQILRRTW